MDPLKQSLEIQRTENEIVKKEIMTKLEELLHPLDVPINKCNISSTKYNNYISELCQLEQKIHHKLTEINYDLKKFKMQNKCPECKPLSFKSDDSLDDIEILKANSSRLISKLDKLRDQNSEDMDNQLIHNKKTENKSKCFKTISHEEKDFLIDFDSSVSYGNDKFVELVDVPMSTEQELNANKLCENKDNKGLVQDDISFDLLNLTLVSNKIEDNSTQASHVSSSINKHNSCEFVDISSQDSKIPNSEVEVKIEYDLKNELIDLEDIPATQKDLSITRQNDISIGESIITKPDPDVDKKIEPQDAMSNLSEVMWKNIIELDLTLPKNSKVSENVATSSTNSPRSYKMSAELCDVNISDETKIASDVKFRSLLEVDSARSSYDSENDSGVLPGSDSSLGISEGSINQLVKNQNLCDSSKKKFNKLIRKDLSERFMIDNSSDKDSEDSRQEKVICEPKPDSCKPSFSADEKIRKLGLEDRKTLFERTRKSAILPDLSLRPSKSSDCDVQKLKHVKKKKNEKCEIGESEIPTTEMGCVFSHVESPSEFYIHLDIEESKMIDCLNDMITEQYKHTKTRYHSKREAFKSLGMFCCAYVREHKMYYRAEIIDWIFEENENSVLVKLVDYGNNLLVHYKCLRRLTEEFSILPRLAVKCYFPFLYPPGSTKNNLLLEWPKSTTEALFELSGLGLENKKPFFRISYIQVEKHGIGIELYQVNGQNHNMMGQLLIDLGHAVEIILPEDDPMGILSDEEEIENMENCDNINEVVLGYDPKDEARICKFTKHDGERCFKRACKLEHAKFSKGGYTTDTTPAFVDTKADLKLPKPGDKLSIMFTTFLEATRFYVNLTCYADDIRQLERIMNNPSNSKNFEPFKIFPAYGEIVLVKHWQNSWLRAKVRHHLYNENGKCTGVQVFMVDYGDIIDVPLNCVKKIREEYLEIPFQAVECILHGYKDSGNFQRKDLDRFFYENLVFRKFSAEVQTITDMQMSVNLFYKDENLGDILVEYGYLIKADEGIPMPHSNSITIPG